MADSDTFEVKHLASGQTFQRQHIFLNPLSTKSTSVPPSAVDQALATFHERLPHSGITPLYSLPDVARELGIGHVFLKDESLRFGLPSFKILGASWAVFRSVCEKIGLPTSVSLEEAGKQAQKADVELVTCTDGNWGRALSRMAKYMGIKATIFVPGNMDEATKSKIRNESACVNVVQGSYDDSIAAAIEEADQSGAILVMDTSWDEFEQSGKWVVEGYSTMHAEVDQQVREACGKTPTVCVASVGVGSWAQSVVAHYKAKDSSTKIITVESEAAPCLMESLHNQKIVPIETGETIMCGMNCGTVSNIAWPVLKDGVFASVAVNDIESHEQVRYLSDHEVNAGPCGAAPLAALKKLYKKGILQANPDEVVVLFSTEGYREYVVPVGVQ